MAGKKLAEINNFCHFAKILPFLFALLLFMLTFARKFGN